MRVEVLAIGDELLDGRVADTNTMRLARALAPLGLEISRRSTVRDDPEAIIDAARSVMARGTALCVVSGGLGPTADDCTGASFARLAGVALVRDEETVRRITERLSRRGRPLTANQLQQADRPEGATLVPNHKGTAPGFVLTLEGAGGPCRFVSVPGVPFEFDAMIEDAVIAPLRVGRPALLQAEFRSFGLMEAEVDHRLVELPKRFASVRVGFRVRFPEVHVTLLTEDNHRAEFVGASDFVRTALGEAIFSEQHEDLPLVVVNRLKARGAMVAVAESCTGGFVSDLLTDIPGASDVFAGGMCAYREKDKILECGVDPTALATHGVVSEAVAAGLAQGIRLRLGSTWGVGITGIAGPGGGTPEVPVGTIWVALSSAEVRKAVKLQLPFERRNNKVVAAFTALDMLRRLA